jgi:hypothetical protein
MTAAVNAPKSAPGDVVRAALDVLAASGREVLADRQSQHFAAGKQETTDAEVLEVGYEI